MIRRILLIAIVAVIVMPLPAAADPKVRPSSDRGSVVLRNEIVERRQSSAVTSPASLPATSTSRPEPLNFGCRTDPETGIYGCREVDPPEPEDDGSEVTEADVLRAAQEIGMPRLAVNIQPGDRTLVNAETIFYAEPQPFERSVTLLGTDVDLAAEPARFTWVHGDGTRATTAKAGRPYPAFDVVHRYARAADRVEARVDVTYRVRYRIDGGAWQALGQTLTASGPTTGLEVREAAPVLTRP